MRRRRPKARSTRRPRLARGERPARRPGRDRANARRTSKDGTPLAPSGSLSEVLKFQAKSTAALRAVKMPMAVEPSFIFKP